MECASCHGDSPPDAFSLRLGYALNWTGRLSEGLEELGRCLGLADQSGEIAGYALTYAAEAHYCTHDPDRTLASARQVEEIGAPGHVARLAQELGA